MTYTNEDLIAFHDGTLPTTKAEAILRALETDDGLARRLMALDPGAGMVSNAFAEVTPPPPPTLPRPEPRRLWKPLAAVAATMVGAVLIWSVVSPKADPWHLQVSAYQALYTPQTIAMIEQSDATLAAQFARLDAALTMGFGPSDLDDVKGLDLLRAQLLGFDGAALGQIVFSDHLGRPIALCLMAGGGDPSFTARELSGLNTVSWGNETHRFILVAPAPEQDLRAWAEAIRASV